MSRTEQLNTITFDSFREIHDLCARLTEDDTVRAVVLTGAGRLFSAGLHLDEADTLTSMSAAEMTGGQEYWASAFRALHELRQPLIAAVNGPAAGGGLALALAADIRLASPAARFNAAFVRIGLSAGDIGVSWSLPRIVGLGHASEMMLTGRFVEAEEAARIGLVNRVVPAESLLDSAYELTDHIVANSPLGTTLTKRVLESNVDAPSLHSAMELENRNQVLATRGEDFHEALAAFREKRAPRFTGR
jgi:enoyl-CoA hydratase